MERSTPPSIEHWIDRATRGDREAFRRFVEQTHGPAFRLALRIVKQTVEAEDVIQDAYLRAWRALPRLRDRGAARGWLFTIVRNVAMNRADARRRRRHRDDAPRDGSPWVGQLLSDRPAPDDAIANRQLGRALTDVVAELEDKYRVILLLRVVDGMSYDELAEVLGIPIGTVGTRLLRSRQLLAEQLEARLGMRLEVGT